MITVEELLAEQNKDQQKADLILPRENVYSIEGKSLDEVYSIVDEHGNGRRGWGLYLLNGSLPNCAFARKTSQLIFRHCDFRNTEFNQESMNRFMFTACNLDGAKFTSKDMGTVGFRQCSMSGTIVMPESASQVTLEADFTDPDSIQIDHSKYHWSKRDLFGKPVLWLKKIAE